MRLAAKVDANQSQIVQALRKIGVEVTPLHQLGKGVPDLLCSYRQRWVLLECKSKGGKLTPNQVEWIGRQKAPVYVVTSPLEAVDFMQRIP